MMNISLRDWFAGQALAGLCALPAPADPEKDARLAYRYADAMLHEREKWLSKEISDKIKRRQAEGEQ